MEGCSEVLDLSRRGLKKIEKAAQKESTTVTHLILDQNELQRLDNLDSFTRIENLSICNNFLLRMHGVSRLANLRELCLNNNGILQIEGLKEMTYLRVLKLAGNNIKSIEHLNHNTHLEYLDLYHNHISIIADISYLKSLKHLNLEHNRIIDLRQCDRYLPPSLEHLHLAHNSIQDLNEISHLGHLRHLDTITVQGNPCVPTNGKSKISFDYRPFVLNWIMSVKSIDGYVVSAMESLKAEWLYSQGKGRAFHPGEHRELCEYLASTCPATGDNDETEDQRKLRLILNKAQQHQQQLKEQTCSPNKSRLQSPRMQNRYTNRGGVWSPDRMSASYHAGSGDCRDSPRVMTASYHAGAGPDSRDSPRVMTASYHAGSGDSRDSSRVMAASCDETVLRATHSLQETTAKPVNQPLEAASKMVPVPESLMSPDYQDPMYDMQKLKPHHLSAGADEKAHVQRHIQPPTQINRNLKSSPKLTKSASSSPRLKSKLEQRKNSLSNIRDIKCTNGKTNGVSEGEREISSPLKLANQKRKNSNVESMAAVTIQKMWRGYRSRNLNKESMRILHAIQAARSRQHIMKLTSDMEATKAALESERKIQQLQMQAINALWKKVSIIQDTQKLKPAESEESSDTLKQLSEMCINLQSQVVQLQGCMQEILRVVTNTKGESAPVATQTDISALITPQEEKCTWLKRPQSLPLTSSVAPALPSLPPRLEMKITTTKTVLESPLPLETPLQENKCFINQGFQDDTQIQTRQDTMSQAGNKGTYNVSLSNVALQSILQNDVPKSETVSIISPQSRQVSETLPQCRFSETLVTKDVTESRDSKVSQGLQLKETRMNDSPQKRTKELNKAEMIAEIVRDCDILAESS